MRKPGLRTISMALTVCAATLLTSKDASAVTLQFQSIGTEVNSLKGWFNYDTETKQYTKVNVWLDPVGCVDPWLCDVLGGHWYDLQSYKEYTVGFNLIIGWADPIDSAQPEQILTGGGAYDYNNGGGYGGTRSFSVEFLTRSATVPIPASLPLLIVSFSGLLFFGRQRKCVQYMDF